MFKVVIFEENPKWNDRTSHFRVTDRFTVQGNDFRAMVDYASCHAGLPASSP